VFEPPSRTTTFGQVPAAARRIEALGFDDAEMQDRFRGIGRKGDRASAQTTGRAG
jgi:hypothetical protein